MEPSSSTAGFFQQLPTLGNQFHDDPSVQRILKLFVPAQILDSTVNDIEQHCNEALEPRILDWVTDAEKNQPYLSGSGRNAFGEPVSSKLIVTEGWQRLQNRGFEKGLSAQGYEPGLDQYTRVVQYMRLMLWEGSSANTSCPQAMQDGATRLLQRHLATDKLAPIERKVFQDAFDHLISRDPGKGWTSGQWMTERTGGSDVSKTETVATYSPLPSDAPPCDPNADIPLGPWSISGFKWFSSATDSNMTILLARTPKGLSTFYAPMRRYNPTVITSATGNKGGLELNGVTISRLKNKMGTKSLPTAELELKGMRGWLVGQEGRGIQEITTLLTITRVRTAVGAMGYLSRTLAIARAFAKVREVGAGRGARVQLTEAPLHMNTLCSLTVEYHGMLLLVFYTVYIMGLEEHPTSAVGPPSDVVARITPQADLVIPLLRVLTPILKGYCSKQSVSLIYACMESLGGVGYLENSESEHLNVARIFRDACVLSIWEGTTDVLSTDLVRALKHPREGAQSMQALDRLIAASVNGRQQKIVELWQTLKQDIKATSQADLLSEARGILWRLAEILTGALYTVEVDILGDERAKVMCQLFLDKKGLNTSGGKPAGKKDTMADLIRNQRIVFGNEWTTTSKSSSSKL
ncbi:very-long-chain acyl-CoA dehydrogenase [Xylariales sp. PMI_506]|nr:very-long-chain acyl-CoA dehydrogenase [Xylariales sp. PMI_506]